MNAIARIHASDTPPTQAWANTWYLAHTKPKQETTAAEQLARQGYEIYLPLYKTWSRPTFRRAVPAAAAPKPAWGFETRFEPMFPRYVFFKPGTPAQSVSPARSTLGVCTLVSFGLGPARVHTALVDEIRALEMLRNETDAQTLSPFQPGTTVRLKSEPMQALQGLVVATSGQRVTLLLEILGRPTTVHTQHDQIELA